MTKNDRERLFLLEEIAAAELKIAQMDFQEAAEDAAPDVICGAMISGEVRWRLQDTLMKLADAKIKYDEAVKAMSKDRSSANANDGRYDGAYVSLEGETG